MAQIWRKNKVLMILPANYEFTNGNINVKSNNLIHIKSPSDIILNHIPVHHLISYVPPCDNQSYQWYIYYCQLFLNGQQPTEKPSSDSNLQIIFYKDLKKDEKKAWDNHFKNIKTYTSELTKLKSQDNYFQKILLKIKSKLNTGHRKGINDTEMECIK